VRFGVERDVTAYSALLRQPGPGWTQLGNVIDDTYVGIYYVTMQLLFYPGKSTTPGPTPPDVILPAPPLRSEFRRMRSRRSWRCMCRTTRATSSTTPTSPRGMVYREKEREGGKLRNRTSLPL